MNDAMICADDDATQHCLRETNARSFYMLFHNNVIVCLFAPPQLQRDLASLRSTSIGRTGLSVQAILDRWQLFCEKPPKGFEKYFKPTAGKEDNTSATAEASTSATAEKSAAAGDKPTAETTDTKSPPLSKPPGATTAPDAAKQSDWNFGMFSPTGKGGGGGSGRQGGGDGNSDRDKWLLLGGLGVAGLLGLVAMMEVSYKEIGWKEFVNK